MPLPRQQHDLTAKKRSSEIRHSTVKISVSKQLNQDEIARLAYALWQARGCPHGSAEIDWLQAEEQLWKQGNQKKLPPVKRVFLNKSALVSSSPRPASRTRRKPQVEPIYSENSPEKRA